MKRKPDFVIGDHKDPYLLRWWIIPRNNFFNIYLHKFLRSDDPRAPHDHPWHSFSILLKGCMRERCIERYIYDSDGEKVGYSVSTKKVKRFMYRNAEYIHQILIKEGETAWTLFLTGPAIRKWGFHCLGFNRFKWVPWREFVGTDEGGASGVGKGCDE